MGTNESLYKFGLALAVIIIIGLLFKSCEDSKLLKTVKLEESNLRKALADTIVNFQTKEGYWGVEKRTLQADVETLKDDNLVLNGNQKKLLKEIERQNKNGETFAAALIELKTEITKIKNDKPVNQTDSSVQFVGKTSDFEYDIDVFNVKPFSLKQPSLSINKISIPNTQTINFHWKNDKKEGYPVSFSVINTNPFIKVSDVQSFTIPEIKKTELKPTFWNKLGTFSKTTGGKVIIFGSGLVLGGMGTVIMLK